MKSIGSRLIYQAKAILSNLPPHEPQLFGITKLDFFRLRLLKMSVALNANLKPVHANFGLTNVLTAKSFKSCSGGILERLRGKFCSGVQIVEWTLLKCKLNLRRKNTLLKIQKPMTKALEVSGLMLSVRLG